MWGELEIVLKILPGGIEQPHGRVEFVVFAVVVVDLGLQPPQVHGVKGSLHQQPGLQIRIGIESGKGHLFPTGMLADHLGHHIPLQLRQPPELLLPGEGIEFQSIHPANRLINRQKITTELS